MIFTKQPRDICEDAYIHQAFEVGRIVTVTTKRGTPSEKRITARYTLPELAKIESNNLVRKPEGFNYGNRGTGGKLSDTDQFTQALLAVLKDRGKANTRELAEATNTTTARVGKRMGTLYSAKRVVPVGYQTVSRADDSGTRVRVWRAA